MSYHTPPQIILLPIRFFYLQLFLYFHRKADISAVDKESYTPLMLAAYKGNIPAFKALLDRKANIDDIDENSKSVVHLAAEQDHAELLKASM